MQRTLPSRSLWLSTIAFTLFGVAPGCGDDGGPDSTTGETEGDTGGPVATVATKGDSGTASDTAGTASSTAGTATGSTAGTAGTASGTATGGTAGVKSEDEPAEMDPKVDEHR